MKGEPSSLLFLAMAAYLRIKKKVHFNVRRVNSSQDILETNAIGVVN